MTTTTEPLAEWERDLPIDPLGPERRAELDRRAAIVTGHIAAMPPVPGRWERSALHAAALEAVRYPDPSALLDAVHTNHGSLAQTQTLSGYGIACREAVAALAAEQGQHADTSSAGAWLEARIGTPSGERHDREHGGYCDDYQTYNLRPAETGGSPWPEPEAEVDSVA